MCIQLHMPATRRTAEEITEEAHRIVECVRYRGALRAEDMAALFSCTSRYLEKPLKLALRKGWIFKAGNKRWTYYAYSEIAAQEASEASSANA